MRNIYKIAYLALTLVAATNIKAAGMGADDDRPPHACAGAGAGGSALSFSDALEALDEAGRTPLINAIIADDVNKVKELLTEGAQPDNPGTYGYRPLIIAIKRNHKNCVDLLLDARADVEALSPQKNTPLIMAIRSYSSGFGNLNIVRRILEAGANPLRSSTSAIYPNTSPLEIADGLASTILRSLLAPYVERRIAFDKAALARRTAYERARAAAWPRRRIVVLSVLSGIGSAEEPAEKKVG